ncbi:MAG TPA: caspase family protein [Solimonas sp.]|nr:caspase family protein [Solimonas sp.]
MPMEMLMGALVRFALSCLVVGSSMACRATLRRSQAYVILLALAFPWSAQAQGSATPRVALVVGNDRYAAAPLDNAARGAREVAAALRRSGFEVIEVIDGSKVQIESAIERMRSTLQGRHGVGLFYYAGHAVQIDWRNFIVPTDAALRVPRDVATQTVDVANSDVRDKGCLPQRAATAGRAYTPDPAGNAGHGRRGSERSGGARHRLGRV